MVGLIPTRIEDLDQGAINELIHLGNFLCVPTITPSFDVGHQISFANGWLMFDVMNNALSQYFLGTNST
jgi:hypothetical protein